MKGYIILWLFVGNNFTPIQTFESLAECEKVASAVESMPPGTFRTITRCLPPGVNPNRGS